MFNLQIDNEIPRFTKRVKRVSRKNGICKKPQNQVESCINNFHYYYLSIIFLFHGIFSDSKRQINKAC